MRKFPTTRASLLVEIRDPNNVKAWIDFTDLYQPVIYRLARAKGLQPVDAEDVTQEVMVKVANSVETWKSQNAKGSFRKWLRVVLRNLVVQRFARKGVIAKATEPHGGTGDKELGHLLDDSPGLSEFVERESQLEAFRVAARRIRSEFSEATWLAFWKTWIEELPIKRVAEELKMSAGAIYIARSRVMRRLREEAICIHGLNK